MLANARDTLRDLPVLIVAHNRTYLHLLEKLFTRWSMVAETANDVQVALDIISQAAKDDRRFRLVVADSVLPHIDGFALAQSVRKYPRLAAPIILLVSALDRRNHPVDCHDPGITCLEKPIFPSNLFKAVTTSLEIGQKVCDSKRCSPAESDSHTPAKTLHVLLAEDTPANQKLIISILNKRGHTVTVAETGQKALEFVEYQDFDIVLMDVQMPILDGFQTTRAIRKLNNRKKAKLPIIAMTAHALKEDAQRCLDSGMDAYLSKPIDVTELTSLVERMAEKDIEVRVNRETQTAI
jgi:CheY-like chemotaxis protein